MAIAMIGLLRSWDTVLTKSFFIRSRFLSSVMSRRMAARPTGSPYSVVTKTRLAWAVRPSGRRSSTTPGCPISKRRRSGSCSTAWKKDRPVMDSGATPSMARAAGLASSTSPSCPTITTASAVLVRIAARVPRSSASAWYARQVSSAPETPAASRVATSRSSRV